MLIETPRRPAAVGSQRFLVRGRGAAPEASLVIVRERTNEYPERFPLDPIYPRPGRRGASPAPRSTAGAPPPGAAPTPGAPPTPPPPPTPGSDPYPPPRDRGDSGDIDLNSNIPSPGSPDASASRTCAGNGGAHMQIGIDLANGSTDVRASTRIDRPFKITYVEHYSDGSAAGKTQFRLKVATDNDTTGGLSATGVNLDELNLGGDDFLGDGQLHRSYPNKIVTTLPAYIKFCHSNATGAQRAFQTICNIEYLD